MITLFQPRQIKLLVTVSVLLFLLLMSFLPGRFLIATRSIEFVSLHDGKDTNDDDDDDGMGLKQLANPGTHNHLNREDLNACQSSGSETINTTHSRPLVTAYHQLPKMRLDPQLVQRNPIDTSICQTEAGVLLGSPTANTETLPSGTLYTGVDYNGDSSSCTVMGMATGYPMIVYQRFVGSLRKSGFAGSIILGVSPDTNTTILDYLYHRNVTVKILDMQPCSFRNSTKCAVPYLDIKTRWSRFALQRDWLEDCPECSGPILISDVRDTIFQLDPFGPGSPTVKGLFVFEEDPSQHTDHWLTDVPFKNCKGIRLDEVMLCSGTTVGTRTAMLKYLEIMYAEMKVWATDPKCRFGFHGDDQSIHNYLYYSGQLPFATAWRNRGGGHVNTVGKIASNIQDARARLKRKESHPHLTIKQARDQVRRIPFPGYEEGGKSLLSVEEYGLTDRESGKFTEDDGKISRVVHQWDRFGSFGTKWLDAQNFAQDPFP